MSSEHDLEVSGGPGKPGRLALQLAWVLVRVVLLIAFGATSSTFVYEQF